MKKKCLSKHKNKFKKNFNVFFECWKKMEKIFIKKYLRFGGWKNNFLVFSHLEWQFIIFFEIFLDV